MTTARWPEEFESLRAEARQLAEALGSATPQEVSEGDDAAVVAEGRAFVAAAESTAPTGRDEVVAGVPCRAFEPVGRDALGTYVHFHGGAMVYGSPRLNDTANEALSEQLGVRVVSVDYRLAPEHPHPAGLDDCVAVTRNVIDGGSPRVVVGGESAGGYFAVQTLLRLRDLGLADRVVAANLAFGVYDLSGTPSFRGARASSVPDVLHPRWIDLILRLYAPSRSREDGRDPEVSPLFAELQGLPPALFTVGDADHLLDDSLFMAARWEAAGNGAELAVYPDCPHAFTMLPTALAARANERIAAFLAAAFQGETLPAR